MRSRIRPRLTYANVMSTIAVVLVLAGGSAYAANTIFSTDIVDGEVKTPDLASSAVTTGKVADNQIFSADVRDDTLSGGGLTAADLGIGSVGPAEANGLTGADIVESSLTGNARKLLYNGTATDPPALTKLATVGPYTLKASCADFGSQIVQFTLFAQGPLGFGHWVYDEVANDDPSLYHVFTFHGATLQPNTANPIAQTSQVQDHATAISGTAMLSAGSSVVEVDFYAYASSLGPPGPSTCALWGAATNAT